MTLPIFPELDGIAVGTTKHPEFKTGVFEALSGLESRVKFRRYPKYTFGLNLEFLIENREEQQLTELMGFMLGRAGMYAPFLFKDATDYRVTDQVFGVGDGVSTEYQLIRTYGGFDEPVQNINEIYTPYRGLLIDNTQPENTPGPYLYSYIDGELVVGVKNTDYTLSDTGLVTFFGPVADGQTLYWQGDYYYRVRFVEDGYDFAQLMTSLYECQDIQLIGSVRNAV